MGEDWLVVVFDGDGIIWWGDVGEWYLKYLLDGGFLDVG